LTSWWSAGVQLYLRIWIQGVPRSTRHSKILLMLKWAQCSEWRRKLISNPLKQSFWKYTAIATQSILHSDNKSDWV
jgi:hypothetical protein